LETPRDTGYLNRGKKKCISSSPQGLSGTAEWKAKRKGKRKRYIGKIGTEIDVEQKGPLS
jgi:hypothetical protein